MIVLAGINAWTGWAQEASMPKLKPEISLTLIPPSPVTDQITLDVRGAVWNRTDTPDKYTVGFYLDGKKLHEETLDVAPQSAAGVKFQWPTKGNAGTHKVMMLAKNSRGSLRQERPLRIIPSDVPSARRLGGAWVDLCQFPREGRFYNPELVKMTDQDWRELVRAMHESEQDVIVISWSFQNPRKALYPSKLCASRMPIASEDPIETIMDEADKLGMHVIQGVGHYAFFDYSDASLAWNKQVADELWERYGHHPSFYGWYMTQEGYGNLGNAKQRKEVVAYCKDFSAHVRRLAPDKPLMMARNTFGLRGAEDTYRQLFPYVDILTFFCFQRMKAGDMSGEQACEWLQSLCKGSGTHLWMDLESFLMCPDNALFPRPIEGLISDFQRFTVFEKILHYSFTATMSSPRMPRQPGGAPTVKLYEDYQKYLREGADAFKVNALTRDAKLALGTAYSPLHSGRGERCLIDGWQGNLQYLRQHWQMYLGQDPFYLWQGYLGTNLDATLDLGAAKPVESISINCLEEPNSGMFLPTKVEIHVSSDGATYRPLEILTSDERLDRAPEVMARTYTSAAAPGSIRYVRVRAQNFGVIPEGKPGAGKPAWLMADEIVVKHAVKK